MSDVTGAILGGLAVLILGQIIIKFMLEPIHDLRELLGETEHVLIFYKNVYANPPFAGADDPKEVSRVIRNNASRLIAKSHAVPLMGLWSSLGWVPDMGSIRVAHSELIGLSNNVGNPEGALQRLEAIVRALDLRDVGA